MTAGRKVQTLRAAGYRVFISHKRYGYDPDSDSMVGGIVLITAHEASEAGLTLDHWGGLTTVAVYKGDELISHGEAICSRLDRFDRKLGLEIAVGRALKKSPELAGLNEVRRER